MKAMSTQADDIINFILLQKGLLLSLVDTFLNENTPESLRIEIIKLVRRRFKDINSNLAKLVPINIFSGMIFTRVLPQELPQNEIQIADAIIKSIDN